MVGPGRPKFVLFGSSMVQMGYNAGGWSAVLADLYARKADVLLRGYSGWNSRMALQALDRIFPKDAAVQPSLVVVYFGGNDATNPHPSGLGGHVPLPEYVDNMKKIIVHLKSLSDKTRIICLSSPPVNEAKVREFYGKGVDDQARTNEACRIYSEALVELCKELDVEAINIWAAFQQRDDWASACLVDGIHLSAEGSKVVVAEILKILKKVNWEPSLYWLSMPAEFPEDSPYYVVRPDGKTTQNVTDYISARHMQWLNI
ncbi:GDSL esterase/lipase CPRD49 [Sesamum angolense]|uniref:GDSL esterase/lipase CPRD49 n=1 Tax=Sesamum angolense TaxID=2727404 RepID=A0AAE1WFX5_9LAMI|nr:GDSL esterase/lipase CPRD49 [Sesamum angolense]